MKQIKQEFSQAKSARSNWNTVFQTIGEYCALVKLSFESQPDSGAFLLKEIYDSTGVFAAQNAASALIGMLWPGSAKQSIEIAPPEDIGKMSTELSQFYDKMGVKLCSAMDAPEANLALSVDEYMLDQMLYSTSGVGVEGRGDGLFYKSYGVKEIYIEEGKDGKVGKIFLFFEWTVDRVIEEYGFDKVSKKVSDKQKSGNGTEKVKVLVVIRKRKEKKATEGKMAMPFEGIHLEFDSEHKLKEDGFFEMPIHVGRFRKMNGEVYGRGPSMNALPDIAEANTLRQAVIVATEKALDMPQGVLNDGVIGGGVVDTSAGGITVFNASGNLGTKNPIFDIGSPPDVKTALARLETLEKTIAQHYFIDRLLDFNNEQQMTFGEAQIRDQIRTSSLSSLFSRQIAEVFSPLVERSISIMFRAGLFGVVPGSKEEKASLKKGVQPEYIPDELVQRLKQNKDIYQIRYKTVGANASRAQEYMAILDILQLAAQGIAVDPTLALRVDLHKAFEKIASIRGIPTGIIREDDEFKKLLDEQKKQQQQMQMAQMAEQASGAVKNVAQAGAFANKAT